MSQDKTKLPVEEFTTPNPITADIDTGFGEMLRLMKQNNIRHLPITMGKKTVGIVSERDLKVVYTISRKENLTAKDLMTEEPYTVTCDTTIEEVALTMSKNKIGSAIVEEANGDLYGIFTSTDALNALIELLRGDV